MPRPRKCRRVCCMPQRSYFGPLEQGEPPEACITMTVDEFECIRLIDWEDMTQEECAQRMQVARTTAQAIYGSARKKLAESVIYGKPLHINGGDYVLCGHQHPGGCGCGKCHRECGHNAPEQEDLK